jgi:hypothetical protein
MAKGENKPDTGNVKPPHDPALVRVLTRLLKRFHRDIIKAALDDIPDPPPKQSANNLKIYREVIRRRRAGEPATLTDAAREVMKTRRGTPKDTVETVVKRFDGFSFDDPKRGFDKGKFYKE